MFDKMENQKNKKTRKTLRAPCVMLGDQVRLMTMIGVSCVMQWNRGK